MAAIAGAAGGSAVIGKPDCAWNQGIRHPQREILVVRQAGNGKLDGRTTALPVARIP